MLLKKYQGYTLAEILIVISILAIIGTIALIGINPLSQIFRGFDTRRRADLNRIKIAFESYYSDKGCYPSSTVLSQCGSDVLKPYLEKIPCDPNDNKPYKVKTIPANSSCPQQYAIYASLYSFFTQLTTSIPGCPKTFAVYSENMTSADLIQGCSGVQSCINKYGCKSGSCTIVGVDIAAPCRPSSCDSDCGGINCAQKNVRGRLINECVPF